MSPMQIAVLIAILFLSCQCQGQGSKVPSVFTGAGVTSNPCPVTVSGAQLFAQIISSNINIQTTGCPPIQDDWMLEHTDNTARYQCFNLSYPYPPILQDDQYVTYVSLFKDKAKTIANPTPIAAWQWYGVTTTGVTVMPNVDFMGRDAYEYEGFSLDPCGGHANPYCVYHYHTQTKQGCVYNSSTGVHDPLMAVMADGVPMYGPLGDGGVAPTNLDICGGHNDSTYPFYHYHVAANYTYPYLIACLRGCLGSQQTLYSQSNTVLGSTCTPSTKYPAYNYSLYLNAFLAKNTNNAASYSCSLSIGGSSGAQACAHFSHNYILILVMLTIGWLTVSSF